MSVGPGSVRRGRMRMVGALMALAGSCPLPVSAAGGDGQPPYPFEGAWVRADRVCSAGARTRNYTARDVTSAGGRCVFRKVTFGSGQWDIQEECRKAERPGVETEVIRMLGADVLLLKHQIVRLKIPRGRRWVRCAAGAMPSKPPAPTR